MVPNVLNCDFFLRRFLILVAIIVAEVPGVQDIVSQRITMISERLNVMGSDEPVLLLLPLRQRVLNVLQVVVWG